MLKVQIANRRQRYGYDLGPSYFDHHSTIEPAKVEAFLKKHFPGNRYPIFVKYYVRGYDEASARVIDLHDPREFRVAIGLSEIDSRIANSNHEIVPRRSPNGGRQ